MDNQGYMTDAQGLISADCSTQNPIDTTLAVGKDDPEPKKHPTILYRAITWIHHSVGISTYNTRKNNK